MIKQKVVLEVKVGERLYQMECYSDAPLGEVHDVLSQMKHYVIQKMADANRVPETAKSAE